MVVLFDLDGTLTDPQIGIVRCIQHALTQLGYAAPPAASLTRYIGPPLFGTFQTLLATDDPQRINAAIATYRERFATVGLYENQVYPAIPVTLAALRTAGYTLYVATSKPAIYATRILAHFDLAPAFQRIYGSELDGTRADKYDLIDHLLREEKLDPAATSMVGDREHDILAARRNGVRSIGVLWGYGSQAELEQAGADILCTQPTALLAALI